MSLCIAAVVSQLQDPQLFSRFPNLIYITEQSLQDCDVELRMEPSQLSSVHSACDVCPVGYEFNGAVCIQDQFTLSLIGTINDKFIFSQMQAVFYENFMVHFKSFLYYLSSILDCPSPFTQVENASCYYADDTYFNQEAAEEFCQSLGGHLASLETEVEAVRFFSWFNGKCRH